MRELKTSPNLPSLGSLVEDSGYSFVWHKGQAPLLTRPSGKKMNCKVINKVPVLGEVDHALLMAAIQSQLDQVAAEYMAPVFEEVASEFLGSPECAEAVGDTATPVFDTSRVVRSRAPSRYAF